jgi:hypothetical protein
MSHYFILKFITFLMFLLSLSCLRFYFGLSSFLFISVLMLPYQTLLITPTSHCFVFIHQFLSPPFCVRLCILWFETKRFITVTCFDMFTIKVEKMHVFDLPCLSASLHVTTWEPLNVFLEILYSNKICWFIQFWLK